MIRLLCLLLPCLVLPGLEAGKSVFADRVSQAGTELDVRGAGTLRWRGVVAIYDAALYIDATRPQADPLADDVALRLEFRLRRDLSAAALAEATVTAFGRDLPEGGRAALAVPLGLLCRQYVDLRAGDVIAYTWRPGTGLVLEQHGVASEPIAGHAFARTLYAIWLGPTPVNAGFRDALLARP
jgi:hypothetical protein